LAESIQASSVYTSGPIRSLCMKLQPLLLLILIFSLAALARFYALDRIPPGVYADEASNGKEGIDAVRTGNFKVFYETNNGREGLWINMTGFSEKIFGVNPFGLRFCAALAGTLTVVFLYLLAAELFSARTGIISAWLLASSFWHLNFSRIAFSAVLVPFLLTSSFYSLFRLWREAHEQPVGPFLWLASLVGGTLFGLGFHTYIPFRFAPLLLAGAILAEYSARKATRTPSKIWIFVTGCWLTAAGIVALPISLHFMNHPEDFWTRARQVSILETEQPLREFVTNLIRTAGMFHIRGDCEWRDNVSCSPELFLPVGVLFVLGMAIACKQILRKVPSRHRYFLLFVWLILFLLPELLTSEGIPHALRAIGVIPPVFLFSGIGGDFLFARLKSRRAVIFWFVLLLAFSGAFEFYRYFIVWARQPDVASAFDRPLVDLGRYLNGLPKEEPRYVLANVEGEPVPHTNPDASEELVPMPAQTVIFITRGHPPATYLSARELESTNFPRGSVLIPMDVDDQLISELRKRGFVLDENSLPDTVIAKLR
jgi:4-amino-4-deoxy-L-arabinose transferase-like glycosyltransferase